MPYRPSEKIDRIIDVVEGGILLCLGLATLIGVSIAVYVLVAQ